jgi:hypothetical protein
VLCTYFPMYIHVHKMIYVPTNFPKH